MWTGLEQWPVVDCLFASYFEPRLNASLVSVRAHLLPWRWIPSSRHIVHRTGWTGPSVAGFFQVQVWFLNIAAPSLWESYQLSLEGLLAALHFPLPHTQTTGHGALGAKKAGVSVQSSSRVCWADVFQLRPRGPRGIRGTGWRQVSHTHARIPWTWHQVPRVTGEKSSHRAHQRHKTKPGPAPLEVSEAKSRQRQDGRGWDQGLWEAFICMSRSTWCLKSWESVPGRQDTKMT